MSLLKVRLLLCLVCMFALSVGCKEQGEGQPAGKAPEHAVYSHLNLEAAPFSLRDLADKEVSLKDVLSEKPALLAFWATWCPHCAAEIPELNKLEKEYGQKLAVLAINVQEPRSPVAAYAKKKEVSYGVLLDKEAKVARSYLVHGVPTIVLIGKDGNVYYRGHSVAAARQKLRCVFEPVPVKKVYEEE